MDEFDYEEMEMPTPCINCGEIFDLNDGYASEKWYPNITICKSCHRAEMIEIEMDNELEELNIELSNALYVDWDKINHNNMALIINIVKTKFLKLVEKQKITDTELISKIDNKFWDLLKQDI